MPGPNRLSDETIYKSAGTARLRNDRLQEAGRTHGG
jgi:hypothetical protein